ncbi:hypothetical protein D3C73_1404800 [compost metagenome]
MATKNSRLHSGTLRSNSVQEMCEQSAEPLNMSGTTYIQGVLANRSVRLGEQIARASCGLP